MIRHAARMLAIMYCVCSQPAYSNYEFQAVTPPLSFSQFCIQYPEDCQHHDDRRIRDFRSSIQRWRELAQINSTVNVGMTVRWKGSGVEEEGYDAKTGKGVVSVDRATSAH